VPVEKAKRGSATAIPPGTSHAENTMEYQVYKDASSQWRWRLQAANHRIIAVSSESYVNKQDCLNAITLVKSSSAAPVVEK
jgi:uncharacterized protein YegP (UPF0339 family)